MASGPDLFVVCKSCGSEVSPYITECPYCGTRLRKRAPKLERGGTPEAAASARARGSRRCARGEIPGIRPDRRPYATISLVLASIVVTLVGLVGLNLVADDTLNGIGLSTLSAWGELALGGPLDGEWWRLCDDPVRLRRDRATRSRRWRRSRSSATLLERRHGWWAPLLVFVVGGGAGMALVVAARRGHDRGRRQRRRAGDARRLGDARHPRPPRRAARTTPTCSACSRSPSLLVLLPLATDGANSLAGLGGGLTGIVLGLGLARLRDAEHGAPTPTSEVEAAIEAAVRSRAPGGGAADRRRERAGDPADPQRGAAGRGLVRLRPSGGGAGGGRASPTWTSG